MWKQKMEVANYSNITADTNDNQFFPFPFNFLCLFTKLLTIPLILVSTSVCDLNADGSDWPSFGHWIESGIVVANDRWIFNENCVDRNNERWTVERAKEVKQKAMMKEEIKEEKTNTTK